MQSQEVSFIKCPLAQAQIALLKTYMELAGYRLQRQDDRHQAWDIWKEGYSRITSPCKIAWNGFSRQLELRGVVCPAVRSVFACVVGEK